MYPIGWILGGSYYHKCTSHYPKCVGVLHVQVRFAVCTSNNCSLWFMFSPPRFFLGCSMKWLVFSCFIHLLGFACFSALYSSKAPIFFFYSQLPISSIGMFCLKFVVPIPTVYQVAMESFGDSNEVLVVFGGHQVKLEYDLHSIEGAIKLWMLDICDCFANIVDYAVWFVEVDMLHLVSPCMHIWNAMWSFLQHAHNWMLD